MADTREGDLLVLDTHAWLWLMDGDERLDAGGFADAAEEAASRGLLLVSAISLWEVAMLEAVGRLHLSIPVASWLAEAVSTPGLSIVPVDAELAAESAQLPGRFPGDGCDRLIVATTRLRGGRLLTADPRLVRYGSEGHVRVTEIGAPK